ncbi:hypothetical protein BD626DRAFT_572434 [Schizophyllum amplum]|uniref:JmjC domain-containing protein n=2 Tax=Schizophyllum amplum TaxID=97359 RepID=A0A550C4M0_9AGAR|nr:hypothetical protein BD626DRAFT_572434 [Auriculariopsis ampla]
MAHNFNTLNAGFTFLNSFGDSTASSGSSYQQSADYEKSKQPKAKKESNARKRENERLKKQLSEAKKASDRDAEQIRDLKAQLHRALAAPAAASPATSSQAFRGQGNATEGLIDVLDHETRETQGAEQTLSKEAAVQAAIDVVEGFAQTGGEYDRYTPLESHSETSATPPTESRPASHEDEGYPTGLSPASAQAGHGMLEGRAHSEERILLDLSTGATNLQRSPEIEWVCGAKTRLPRLPTKTFEFDEAQVRAMSKFPNAQDCPDMVTFVEMDKTEPALAIKQAVLAQGRGKWVVLKGAGTKCDPTPEGGEDPAMNLHYLTKEPGRGVIGAALDVKRQVHDMEMRANMMPPTEYGPDPLDTSADDSIDEDASDDRKKRRPGDGSDEDPEPFEPYVDRTIREFVEDINSDAHIQCILDVPGGLVRDDGITKYLSDGHLETSTASYAGANLDYEFRPADIARTANWCLLHQAGFLTHGHMDASGMGTTFEVRGPGAKLWLALECCYPESIDREKLLQCQKSLVLGIPRRKKRAQRTDDGAGREDFSVDGDRVLRGSVIIVQEGDIIIQPAGKAHVVYTPLHTVTVGSHYVNWMGLPRMELFRSFEKLTDRAATNHDHCYAQLMLIYMAASLPARVKEGGVFFKKPLIALCLMVLWPRKYIHPGSIEERVGKLNDEGGQHFLRRLRDRGGNWVGGNIDRLAQLVCIAVLKRLVPDQFANEPVGSRAIVDLPNMSVIRRSYLFDSSKDWQDPGPEVDIGSCLEKYVDWTPPADDPVLALKGRATAALPRRQAQPSSTVRARHDGPNSGPKRGSKHSSQKVSAAESVSQDTLHATSVASSSKPPRAFARGTRSSQRISSQRPSCLPEVRTATEDEADDRRQQRSTSESGKTGVTKPVRSPRENRGVARASKRKRSEQSDDESRDAGPTRREGESDGARPTKKKSN